MSATRHDIALLTELLADAIEEAGGTKRPGETLSAHGLANAVRLAGLRYMHKTAPDHTPSVALEDPAFSNNPDDPDNYPHSPDVAELLREWEQSGEMGWARSLSEIESQFVLAALYDARRQLQEHPRRCDALALGNLVSCDREPGHEGRHISWQGAEFA